AYMDVNALNLWYLFGMNWAGMDGHAAVSVIAWICFGLSYAYCVALYARSRRAGSLPLAGGALIMLICAFGPMIHERYAYPALLLLLLAFIQTRDRRLLVAVTVLSVTLFLNEVLVLQGGMTEANYGHLQPSEDWLNRPLSVLSVLNTLFVAWTAGDICFAGHVLVLPERAPEPESPARIRLTAPRDHRLRLRWMDIALMAGMTVVYGVTAFVNLGSMAAPQTTWTSTLPGEQIVFDLGDVERFKMLYYGNICSSNFTVELSNDGETWTQPVYAQYNQGVIFRWLWFRPVDENNNTLNEATVDPQDGSAFVAYNGYEGESYPFQQARYVRIAPVSPGLKLMEVGFNDEEGQVLPVTMIEGPAEAEALLDEQDTIPDAPGYYVGTYFDEIYHPRTAYEHLHGLQTYEYTHPPLGKVMMMIGIELFGMTPFGWRFMGTLMGVLMVPMMYLIVKQLTKSTALSAIAMFLLSVDSMHFTQTRLATIDSYSVFWIMVMYFFMFRYAQMRWHTKQDFRRSLAVLGLCGVSMGLGWATKWICLYASAGLAIIFFATLWRHWREAVEAQDEALGMGEMAKAFPKRCMGTLAFCVAFFVLIPVAIYYFSYYWHLQYNGVHSFGDMLSFQRFRQICELQKSMYNYHAGLSGDTHPFRSQWYQWPVIAWPMWYYSGSDFVADGYVSSISCMGNPAVFWFCLAALFFVAIRAAFTRRADRAYVLTIIGFLSQFLPWVLVPRSTFIYHYFASVPFIIIAGVLALDWIRTKSRKGFWAASGALMAASLVLFIMFYPIESGYTVLRTYAQHLRWFDWVNF
ncbi:MAG: phospholipid carrier-dependent glycosyltransferase, partial [Clostridiales bacterium]|nr:phospholipid carrier-dependent glycosyltransferase [Clostridiales bacterium]